MAAQASLCLAWSETSEVTFFSCRGSFDFCKTDITFSSFGILYNLLVSVPNLWLFILISRNTSPCTFDSSKPVLIWAPSSEYVSSRVCDQLRFKPACSATETSYNLEILDLETRDIILSQGRTTKALIRLRGCAGWSAPLLFAYDIR